MNLKGILETEIRMCKPIEESIRDAISQIRKELADRLIALNQFDSGSEKNLGFCVGIGRALKVVADFCEE